MLTSATSRADTGLSGNASDYRALTSLPLEDPMTAWSAQGFRIALGAGYGLQTSFSPSSFQALAGSALELQFRPGYRLNRWWSIGLVFTYGLEAIHYEDQTNGAILQWGIGAEALFHPLTRLGVGLRLGVTGLYDVGGGSNVDSAGVLIGLRVEYLWVVGALFATGPFIHLDLTTLSLPIVYGAQTTTSGSDPTSTQLGASGGLGWWFVWR